MFTLNDLNLICGLAWDEDYSSKLHFVFHEQEGGTTERVTIQSGPWRWSITTTPFATAHLPSSMTFKRTDLHALFRKLKYGYSNTNAVLPLLFTREGFEVKNGPARGTKVATVK